MLKMVRLLRLGRIVTYLKMNKSFKFGAKVLQLLLILGLTLHWMSCFWFVVVNSGQTWIPLTDQDSDSPTTFYSGPATETNQGYWRTYAMLFYESCIGL